VVGSDLVGIDRVGEKVVGCVGTVGEEGATGVEGAWTGRGAGASEPLQDGVPQVSSSPLHCPPPPPPPLGLDLDDEEDDAGLGFGFGFGFWAGFLGLGLGFDPPPPPPLPLQELPSGDHVPGTVGAHVEGGAVGGVDVDVGSSTTVILVGDSVGGGVRSSSRSSVH
jgi:hypothetical protein